MAKALFGHTSPLPDVRLLDEVSRLRGRVADLEEQLTEVRADNQRLTAALRAARLEVARLQVEPMDERDLVHLAQLEHAGR